MSDIKGILNDIIQEALTGLCRDNDIETNFPEIILERPKRQGQGDWATNVALQMARNFNLPPRELARMLVERLPENEHIQKVEIAGPGFINFFLTNRWIRDIVGDILSSNDAYGRPDLGKDRDVQVEFVSANPTGPLHVGHGRGAAVGDITANILSFAGWNVQREYYVNDAGLQMDILGRSTRARYFELAGLPEKAPFPEDGYKGDYIYDLAKELLEEKGVSLLEMAIEDSLSYFRDYASGHILNSIKKDLEGFGVKFDRWFSEKSLYDNHLVMQTVNYLKDKGYVYEEEGAIWFRSTAFEDEKDRVLIRANGVPTYFASDVAYHKEKFDRGFDRVIDVWGADHHGYIPRVRSAIAALGKNPDAFSVFLIQFVNLLRGGEQIAMSTRAGEFITLKDVLDEVGVDATRYFFVMRRSDSHLDFDLDLAKRQSTDNPVYYIQYAHARICSVLKEADTRGITLNIEEGFDEEALSTPEEKRMAARMSAFPEEVEKAALEMAPHVIANYALELAGDFHSFYNSCRILGESDGIMKARLFLAEAAGILLATNLRLLGISAPERM